MEFLQVFGIDCALSKDVPVEELFILPRNKHFSLEEVPAQVGTAPNFW